MSVQDIAFNTYSTISVFVRAKNGKNIYGEYKYVDGQLYIKTDKLKCKCGSTMLPHNTKQHEKCKRHIKYLNSITPEMIRKENSELFKVFFIINL